jgi:hypothetical protein
MMSSGGDVVTDLFDRQGEGRSFVVVMGWVISSDNGRSSGCELDRRRFDGSAWDIFGDI